ncbi:hypothetical protein LZ30DRAFT_355850 [Colletotrichum cereale]|nr:hypothetical protein LZ30DRAFT_355850 [Colletotrichum cereale]
MDCHRSVSMKIAPSTSPQSLRSALVQRSQRFLKLVLMSANSFVALGRIGFSPIRTSLTPKANFRCCDKTLSRIWSDGVNTLDTSTVSKGEEAQSCEVQFGTNAAASMIDSAERDRITFSGDTSKLGSLWLVGAPVHLEDEARPTSDFYSMTYALLLVVAIKNYWLHSGDEDVRDQCLPAAEKLLRYTESREKPSGLIEVPPSMSMHWYSLGESVFGASARANIAYYDALSAVRAMTHNGYRKFQISAKMEILKRAILAHLDSEKAVPE